METGRSQHIKDGGHAVCLYGKLIPTLETQVGDIWIRMFKDNGHTSIQTSLATGTLKFKEIDEKLAAMRSEVKSMAAHVSTLADVIKHSNELQAGIAGEGLTIEGIVRDVLKKMGPTTAGSSTPVMWISLAVICICVTVVVLKVW